VESELLKENMYYAVYDISNDRTRLQTIQTLKDAGLTRIQKSVFCGRLSVQQKKNLVENLKLIAGESESIYLILACRHCFGKVTIIGQGFDKEYVADEKLVEVI